MRKLFIIPTLVLILTVGLAGPTRAATSKPIHTNASGTFTDTLCGISVTGSYSSVDNFTPVFDQAGTITSFRDTNRTRFTLTATNGQSVTIFNAGLHTGSATTNPDGTVTFVDTYKGIPEKITSASGTIHTRDAGVITLATTVRLNPDGTTTVISQNVILTERGPHPEADANFALFCQVITAALT